MNFFPLAETRESRREQLWEVLVFLFLIVPSMVLSFLVIKTGNLSFEITAYTTIVRDLSLVSLIVFNLRRNREALSRIGWNFPAWGREVAWGLALFVPFFFATNLFERVLISAGFSAPAKPLPTFFRPDGEVEVLLAVGLVAVVALAEETIFRGYLILRFRAITGSPLIAVLLSSALFSLGHGYVAPMILHFLQDFIGIVLAPFLNLK
jgi:membrane protease YdiL (CAAX protease family)